MTGWYYLSTPYSKHPRGHDAAADEADRECALLIRAGINALSPISHCHRMFKAGYAAGGDFATWRAWNEALIASSRGVIVCMLDSWEISDGVAGEIAYATNVRKRLVYMKPGIVPPELSIGGYRGIYERFVPRIMELYAEGNTLDEIRATIRAETDPAIRTPTHVHYIVKRTIDPAFQPSKRIRLPQHLADRYLYEIAGWLAEQLSRPAP